MLQEEYVNDKLRKYRKLIGQRIARTRENIDVVKSLMLSRNDMDTSN